jgi:hypothetical protein
VNQSSPISVRKNVDFPALRALQDEHVVDLAARLERPRHRGDEPLAQQACVSSVARRRGRPRRRAWMRWRAVPLQVLEVLAHRVEAVLARDLLHRLLDVAGAELQPLAARVA